MVEKNESKQSESMTITINKTSLWKYSTFILLAVLIVGAFMFVMKEPTTTGNVVNPPAVVPTGQQAVVPATTDNDASIGKADAPVTIIEFSDYQCPFCRKFWTETYLQLKKDYVDTGKVRIVFRDYPLSFHAAAQKSAEAAECVREKGGDTAYFKFHDKMFEEQNILDSGSKTGAVSKTVTYGETELKKWAKDLGYDITSCLDSGKYTQEVQQDMADGQAAGIDGTPGFFINGKSLVGAQPYSAFKAAIDAELANA